MKRLCFGTVYRILYKYRGQKVTLDSLLDAIATSFNVELGNNDSSYAGHLKSGKNGFAKADIDAFRSTTAIKHIVRFASSVGVICTWGIGTLIADLQSVLAGILKRSITKNSSRNFQGITMIQSGGNWLNLLTNLPLRNSLSALIAELRMSKKLRSVSAAVKFLKERPVSIRNAVKRYRFLQ